MAQYTTSQEAMTAGAAKVEDATAQIQQHIQSLRTEVETMMGGWRGDAAVAFAQVHESFEQQAAKLNQALQQMHESLVATSKTYGSQETDQAAAMTNLAGNINS